MLPLDRLSVLLERFRVRTQFSYTRALGRLHRIDALGEHGSLHVLREGTLELRHSQGSGLPRRVLLTEPSVVFYPRPNVPELHYPDGSQSVFTCASVYFDGGLCNPLVRALPPLIALPLSRVEGLDEALSLLFLETDRVRCGHRLLADRLFEVVLIQLLRWLLDNPYEAGVHSGLLMGLSDPRLARVLIGIHESPGDEWTLDRMAPLAGMSRTSFAVHFKKTMGQTPNNYLSEWRITLAQVKLRDGSPIKRVARELGYANPSVLSRTFAAHTGLSPRDWLRQRD